MMNSRTVTPFYSLAALLLLLVVTALVYVPGLNGPPLLDDKSVVLRLMKLDSGEWRDWLADELVSDRGHLGRTVPMATFLANVVFHGDDMRYWNATNVFLHLCTGVLVFLLTFRLTACKQQDNGAASAGLLALMVSGIWLLHPLQVSTVLYTVQRMAQIPALFIFAGLLAYVTGRQRQIACLTGGWLLIGIAFLVLFPLALLSKENGILFPVFTLLIEIFVFRFSGSKKTRRGLTGLYMVILLIPAILGVAYLLLNYETVVLPGYESREFTMSERVITQLRVLVFYIYLLVFPLQRNMGFFHDDYSVSHGFLDPPGTLLAALLIFGMIAGALLVRKKAALPAFGLLFFFVGHSLEASVFSLELVFEHRNYLPAYGIILCLVMLLHKLFSDRRMLVLSGVCILLVLTGLTTIRADTWGSFDKFYNHAYLSHPDSKRVNVIFANNLADAGQYDAALRVMDKFNDAGFFFNKLFVICKRDGAITGQNIQLAGTNIRGVIEHHAVNSLIYLANAGLDSECTISAESFSELVKKVIELPGAPQNKSKILIYEAHFQHRDHHHSAALRILRDAYRHNPVTPIALLLGTEWLIDSGDHKQAKEWYAEALEIVATSKYDFSEYTQSIEARLGKNLP